MIDEIITIAKRLRENIQQSDQIQAFAFGSAIRTDKKPNDIDILIIYDDPVVPKQIRRLFEDLENMPIHLIFLTRQEEIETNFIATQKCIAIL